MFIVQGITLLVMDKPGGFVAPESRTLLRSATRSRACCRCRPAARVRLAAVALAQEHPLRRRRSTRSAATRTRRAPPAFASTCTRFLGLRAGRRLLRARRRLHQRPDRLRRPADRQSDAAADLHRGRARRHAARRRPRRPTGSVVGAYILMMRRQHPARAQRFGLLFDHAEGVILILAVLGGLPERRLANLRGSCALWLRRFAAWRAGTLPAPNRRLALGACAITSRKPPRSSATERRRSGAARRALRYAVPSYVCFVAVVVVTELWLGSAVLTSGATATRSSCCRPSSPSWRWAKAPSSSPAASTSRCPG